MQNYGLWEYLLLSPIYKGITFMQIHEVQNSFYQTVITWMIIILFTCMYTQYHILPALSFLLCLKPVPWQLGTRHGKDPRPSTWRQPKRFMPHCPNAVSMLNPTWGGLLWCISLNNMAAASVPQMNSCKSKLLPDIGSIATVANDLKGEMSSLSTLWLS